MADVQLYDDGMWAGVRCQDCVRAMATWHDRQRDLWLCSPCADRYVARLITTPSPAEPLTETQRRALIATTIASQSAAGVHVQPAEAERWYDEVQAEPAEELPG